MKPACNFLACMLTLLACVSPASAGAQDTWPDFLEVVGGSTDIKAIGGDWVPLAQPLRLFRNEILEARYIREKGSKPSATAALRTLGAFEAACTARSGKLVPDGNPRLTAFAERIVGDLPTPAGSGYHWTGRVAICDDAQQHPIMGFVAVYQDNDALNRRVGTKLLNGLFGSRTDTAVYLFRSANIPSADDQREEAERQERILLQQKAEFEAYDQQVAEFRKTLAIGDATNCGTVIQIRGPMAEIALPPMTSAPNGATTFWARIDRLYPQGPGICTYGL